MNYNLSAKIMCAFIKNGYGWRENNASCSLVRTILLSYYYRFYKCIAPTYRHIISQFFLAH